MPMKTYISLLRGINVSGQKRIGMEELKELYGSLGFNSKMLSLTYKAAMWSLGLLKQDPYWQAGLKRR